MKVDFSEFKCLECGMNLKCKMFERMSFSSLHSSWGKWVTGDKHIVAWYQDSPSKCYHNKIIQIYVHLLLFILTDIPSPWLLIAIPPMQLITMKSKERMSHNKLQNGNYKIKRLKVLHVFHTICYLYIKLKRFFASQNSKNNGTE